MDFADLRDLALALPLATEEPHFDYVSFRIKGKIFATVPPELTHTHIFVEDGQIDAALAHAGVELRHWGKTRFLRVTLADAEASVVSALLRASWARRAPKRLLPG